ncbi:MAG: tetratricopeptide repeat protein, partial [bacterium]|nr:tetratricopeptide repeat protein [bacterium]
PKGNIEQAISVKTQNAVDFWFEGKYEKALQELEIVFALNPDYIRAHHVKALALSGLEKYRESIEIARKSIEFEPENGVSYSILGNCLLNAGKNAEAEENLLKGINLSPDNYIPMYNYACFLVRAGKFKESAEYIKMAYNLSPAIIWGLIERDPDLAALRAIEWYGSFIKELIESE